MEELSKTQMKRFKERRKGIYEWQYMVQKNIEDNLIFIRVFSLKIARANELGKMHEKTLER